MATGVPWTAHELATLERLRREGLSASEIAKQIPGRSRNAVLGMVHRLGMPKMAPRNVMRSKTRVRRERKWRAPSPPRLRKEPKFTPAKPKAEAARVTFTDDPASRLAAAYFAASDAAQRRRDQYREGRRL